MEKINGEDEMIGSSSGEGKMIIKLKIPKLAETEGETTPPEKDHVIGIMLKSSEEGVKKVCLECGKEFSSGKALGGHMRIHVQSAHKNPNFLKSSKTTKLKKHYNNGDRKPYYMNSVNHEGKPTCSQCGKTFPSMKSLFGHMRCHPERVWRGILPPPNTPNATAIRRRASSYSFSSDDDGGDVQVVDLTKILRGWSVTGRRGRRALKPPDEDDVVLLDAVEDLMSLANGGASTAAESNNLPEYAVGKGNAVMDDETERKPPANFSDDESDTNERFLNKQKFKKRKRMKLMMELKPKPEPEQNGVVTVVNGGSTQLADQQQEEEAVVTECKYKCSTCNKCFATHQALGGHRSSHNKPKLTSSDRHPTEEGDHKAFVMNLSGKNLVHQCKICDKIFATGQALGGHQRCHWTGILSSVQAPSSMSQNTSGGQTGCDRKVLDFDLNEIAPEMMEEDEGGNVNGYASSSYNSNIC